MDMLNKGDSDLSFYGKLGAGALAYERYNYCLLIAKSSFEKMQ